MATPIGNLADISLRALHVLNMVDSVACEDTRHTQSLLRVYGIDKPSSGWLALHQHNEMAATQTVLARLAAGERVAYASDAGTPAISDPGARLVWQVRAAGWRVLPVPGASSVTAALSVAGAAEGEHGEFVFIGFLPAKTTERNAAVQALADERRAVVLLEAPHRIEPLAQALGALGARAMTVARELTKQYEQVASMPCNTFASWLSSDPQRHKGEFVVLLHACATAQPSDEGARVLALLLQELPLKTAVRLSAEITGSPRNTLYEQALRLKAG